MDETEKQQLKAPVYASLTLAFASFGDAFLYPFLPVNNLTVGVPIVWVGVLLSINRFVRILSNAWMVHLFAKHGLRFITIEAAALAVLSTLGYAMANHVFVWLIFRIAWGLSFSAMRISTLGYALQQSNQGTAFGLTRGIQEAGPMIALLLAPQLLNYFDRAIIFLLLTLFSLPALYFAWRLPNVEDRTPPISMKMVLSFPSAVNAITFASAFLIDGIIIVVLGILLLQYNGNISPLAATTMAALYLGYRRICLVVFSPAGGWLADKIGMDRIFNISFIAVIMGLIMLVLGWIELGSVIVFTFYSMSVAITPGQVSRKQVHALSAIAENATWRDMGAATGTLAGGALLSTDYLTPVLIFAIFSLILLLFIHWGTAQRALRLLYLWK